MSREPRLQLCCQQCGACQEVTASSMLGMLRQLGMFRREAEPPLDLLVELFRGKAGSFRCEQCGSRGLQVREASGDDWSRARNCSHCGKPIPLQRLELFPGMDLCAPCQEAADRGAGTAAEYCPKCGSIMTSRAVHGRGVTRYAFVCPQCRR